MNVRHDMVAVYVARPDGAGRSHEFLQLRREPHDYLGDTWQTVYGCAEPGESLWRAALRELREEAGLLPGEFFRLGSVASFYTDRNDTVWHVTQFLAVVPREAEPKLNAEHTAARWVHRSHALRQFMWPSDRAAIAEAVRDVLSPASLAREHLRIDTRMTRG